MAGWICSVLEPVHVFACALERLHKATKTTQRVKKTEDERGSCQPKHTTRDRNSNALHIEESRAKKKKPITFSNTPRTPGTQ